MNKEGQTNPEQFQSSARISSCSVSRVEENTRLEEGAIIVWPTRGHVSLSKPRGFLRQAPVCKRFLIKLGPNWQCFYHDIYEAWCDTMPPLMTFWWVLDLQRFKNRDSQCLWPSQDGETVEFIPIRSMGPIHAPQGNLYIFSSHFGALEHVLVVQIWIMYIKCLKNSINE